MKATYEIDEAMMGQEWTEAGDLLRFAEILQTVVGDGVEVVAITDSHNGAENFGSEAVSQDQWNRALDLYAAENPAAFGE